MASGLQRQERLHKVHRVRIKPFTVIKTAKTDISSQKKRLQIPSIPMNIYISLFTDKAKVKLTLCFFLTEQYAMKAYWGAEV